MVKAVAKKTAAARKPVKHSGVAKKAAAIRKPSRVAAAKQPAAARTVDAQGLAHGLSALLHTMQTVQQFEETLCSLMHALRHGRATGAQLRELRHVLEQLPAHDYLHEVHALQDAIAA